MPLIRQLSNPDLPVLVLVSAVSEVPRADDGHIHGTLRESARAQRQRRLTESERRQLATDYEAGMTVNQLAARWEISRTTVMAHLERQGAQTRRPQGRLAPAQLAEAAELYRSGVSLARLGKRYDIDPRTVAKRLRTAGVVLRKANQRP